MINMILNFVLNFFVVLLLTSINKTNVYWFA